MTDEEMAKARATTFTDMNYNEPDYYVTEKEIGYHAYYCGFLGGLDAGRKTKWHKVADGDYPPYEKGNYTISVLTNKGDIAYYNYACWIAEPSGDEIDPPIAWCEIPRYKENI
jgi:hypothetical protein